MSEVEEVDKQLQLARIKTKTKKKGQSALEGQNTPTAFLDGGETYPKNVLDMIPKCI